MKNLKEMTSKELKEIAKGLKISNWWNLKKEVLIAKIEEVQNMSDEEKQARADRKAKEDAAIKEYTKNWGKYTKLYNPMEFIEKWRSGEIVLENDEPKIEEPGVKEETVEEQPIEEKPADTLVETPAPEKPVATITDEKQPTPKRGALIEFDGKAQNICAWGEELGISPNTLYGRIYKMGWSVEKAFTTPARKK